MPNLEELEKKYAYILEDEEFMAYAERTLSNSGYEVIESEYLSGIMVNDDETVKAYQEICNSKAQQ